MIGLVDYGMGNIGSLGNALYHLGLPFRHSCDRRQLNGCRRLILPGVGAFGAAMERLRTLDLIGFLQDWAADDNPMLGICLGMQLLLSESLEHGTHTGLGLIPGQARKIQGGHRDVHMGWNEVIRSRPDPLVPGSGYGYFVHSFHCVPEDPAIVAAYTDYGGPVAAVIRDGNLLGLQFHPEKSQAYGLEILRRFAGVPV